MIKYEWTVEQVTADEYEDIEDAFNFDRLSDALACMRTECPDGYKWELCLIRDVFNNIDADLADRQWAYVVDGQLTEFDGGASIPKKYLDEFDRCK